MHRPGSVVTKGSSTQHTGPNSIHPRRNAPAALATEIMARGAEAKKARKVKRKEERASDLLVNDFALPVPQEEAVAAGKEGEGEIEIPLPPGQLAAGSGPDAEDLGDPLAAAKKRKKKRKKKGDCCAADDGCGSKPVGPTKKKDEGIKTLPLVFLFLLTATTLLPAMFYLSDKFSAVLSKNHIMGSIGHRLGIGPSPKKRVLSFYEKHDPDKIEDVPTIMSKYYGDYPRLVKRLERKYGDYGYFVNWEQDEAPMTLAVEKLESSRDYLLGQWQLHAPDLAKTATRNINHNLRFLYRKGRKMFKKTVWPHLEPFLGVPDERAAKAQKRKDAQEAKTARSGGRRPKNKDYRDDVED